MIEVQNALLSARVFVCISVRESGAGVAQLFREIEQALLSISHHRIDLPRLLIGFQSRFLQSTRAQDLRPACQGTGVARPKLTSTIDETGSQPWWGRV